jgi:DNA-binding MarR family transcriptional regulator
VPKEQFEIPKQLDTTLFHLGQALRKLRVLVGEEAGYAYAIGAGFWQLMLLNQRGEERISEIASALNLDISTVSRQIKSLEARGLIERVSDASDARVAIVKLTQLGRATLTELESRRSSVIAKALSAWDRQDLSDLLDLLSRLVSDLETALGPLECQDRKTDNG